MTALPPNRQMLSGRTHSRLWDSAEYGAALHHVQRRSTLLDRFCWICSGLLLAATAWMVWG